MNTVTPDPQADFARLILQRNVPERSRPFLIRWAAKWRDWVTQTETPQLTVRKRIQIGIEIGIEIESSWP